jgi:GxxExxY protein
MTTIKELCDIVRSTAFAIHVYHGSGHLEKVYENALTHRLRKLGVNVEQQCPIPVLDQDGTSLGDYYADLMVEGRLLVELKAVKTLLQVHVAQVLGYLKSTRMEHGLLMNFGGHKFQIRKYAYSQNAPDMTPDM